MYKLFIKFILNFLYLIFFLFQLRIIFFLNYEIKKLNKFVMYNNCNNFYFYINLKDFFC